MELELSTQYILTIVSLHLLFSWIGWTTLEKEEQEDLSRAKEIFTIVARVYRNTGSKNGCSPQKGHLCARLASMSLKSIATTERENDTHTDTHIHTQSCHYNTQRARRRPRDQHRDGERESERERLR